jgi:WD40 repeat protein
MPISALTFSADGNQLLVGGYHEILIWDPATAKLLQRIGDIPQRVFGMEFNPDQSLLAVAGGSSGVAGEVQLIRWADGPLPEVNTRILATDEDVFFDVSFRPDGHQVAVACSDGSVRMFDVASGEPTLKIDNHADWVTDICYSADGKRIATASRDTTAKVFDTETGEQIATYSGSDQGVEAVAFSADAAQVISASGNHVRVWNVADAKLVGELPGFAAAVFALQSDSVSVIAASADKSVRRFTLADRKQSLAITDHPNWVLSLTWHAASNRISTGCFDGTVSVWSLEDGALLQRFVAIPPVAEMAK